MMTCAGGIGLLLGITLWSGCNNSKSKEGQPNEETSVTALPELPAADAALLKPVPNSKLLATTVLKRSPKPAPGTIHPDCAAYDVTTTYNIQVKYPVTVCTLLGVPDNGVGSGVFTQLAAPTHKLDNAKLPQDQQAFAASLSNSASLSSVWRCRQDSGPWQGNLVSEKGCINNCATDNLLTLLNTPNLIQFEWYGSIISDKPPDFQFVGQPQQVDVEREVCHPQN
jgi:hypothetical protein